MYKIAGQHSLDYPPSPPFLFRYLERLVRSLVYLPILSKETEDGTARGSDQMDNGSTKKNKRGRRSSSATKNKNNKSLPSLAQVSSPVPSSGKGELVNLLSMQRVEVYRIGRNLGD